MTVLDPRRAAFRPDLAAQSLEGKIEAPAFVPGREAQITRATVPIRKLPATACGLETEGLFGETLTVYEDKNGWSWVQLHRDSYVGYVPSDCLSGALVRPAHRVSALGTFVYSVPDIKAPPVMHICMNSVVAIESEHGLFSKISGVGYAVTRHLAPLEKTARDFVEIAERFIGVPYLWGGRTRIGIDCSGLVQTAFQASGLAAPRDSDMQEAEIGHSVPVTAELENLQRGDLVFWKGHAGIMTDAIVMVHANAHHMAVTAEPVLDVAARIAKSGGPVTAIKRPAALSA